MGKRAPGPSGLMNVPHTISFIREQIPYVQRIARKYGDIVQVKLGNLDNLLISDPAMIHEVLVTRADIFHKDIITHDLKELLGEGLLTAEGEPWRRNRKLASPNLQRTQVSAYGAIMTSLTQDMLKSWEHGDERDLHQDMMRLTMEIVVKTLFNLDASPELDEVSHHVEVGMHYFHLMTHTPWRFVPEVFPMPAREEFKESVKELDRVIYGLIERRKLAEEGNDLLFRLIRAKDDEGQGMDDLQLRDEVITMFLAGHETTALVATYTWYLLTKHPEVAKKLFAEVDEVLGSRSATSDDLKSLPYVTAIIKESMRLYPPAWIIGRQAMEDTEIGGYEVKKGTQVLVCQMVLHRKPDVFEDPDAFKPERWLVEGFEKSLPRHAYMPFGGGARICIGNHFAMMEAILIIATMAQHVDMQLRMTHELEVSPAVTMRPTTPVPVRIHRRN